jgi:2-desacetyl-2-hydroxyethyl bacteriochlorophyllide A dehydrogenase
MDALVYRGARRVAMESVAEPTPGPGEVMIVVAHCGICGSDLHGYLGHSARRNATIPLVMGHEFSGKVVAHGAGVSQPALGTEVVVQPAIGCGRCPACLSGRANICPKMKIIGIERAGGFAPLVVVPADRAFVIPKGLDPRVGALTETLAVEVHAFRAFAPPLLRCVVILGAGPQGLLALQVARLSGAEQIVISDRIEARLALASKHGATRCVRADQEDLGKVVAGLTDGWGAEFILDAVGIGATRRAGLASLAPGGTLVEVGLGEGEAPLNLLPLVAREQRIQGTYAYTDDDFRRSMELLASGAIKVGDLLHLAPMGEGGELFRRLVDDPGDLIKVVLTP